MFERRRKMFLTTVLLLLLCLNSSKAMEDRDVDQTRLKTATFVFIENYVNSRNDQPRGCMSIPPCLLQYVPEKLTREFLPHHRCVINVETIDEIAVVLGIKNFESDYLNFKQDELFTKRMYVSNYLVGAVFVDKRESINVNKRSRVSERVADDIARFLKIIT